MVYRNSRIKLSTGQIFWREAGDSDRPTLIFLHGSWHDSTQWQEIVEPLSKDFHCLALDLLGFGNSIALQIPSSIEMEVTCLHEFINALKLRSIYFVGHSLGAWIAINYALKYPNTIQGIVAIAPEGLSLKSWGQYSQLTKLLLANPLLLKSWLMGLQVMTAVSDGADSLTKKLAYWEIFVKFPTTCNLFFRRSTKSISNELTANKLFQFKAPVLILQSNLDGRLAIEQSQAYARSIRNAEYRSIVDLESTASDLSIPQTIDEIKEFIDRVQLKIDREEVELW